ncbi:PDZ domain-containing protein [Lutibacter oricola]|uniref:PDZ domain-containing protein n=1 Tax=Lutibacter oricola TaxID=762486 RepID=A0A1H2WDT2_9FLAO|nr:aspartyl protease family protein [Lutibacter oricola]SDW78802.1 PDZ domain-containing protein [Lutibacter oricola]
MENKKLKILILFIGVFFTLNVSSQGYFSFPNTVKKQSFNFKLLSNLIVLPIEVNGKKLNFILDSGVGATILFNLNARDSLDLKNVKKIKLQGLGGEEAVDAIVSNGNKIKLKSINGYNQKLFVIFNDNFDLSSKLGLTIHGIIGFDLLKNFTVKINYSSKKITFYKANTYKLDDCRKCDIFDLEFYRKKPYIEAGVKLTSDKITPVKLLIDSGGSDAMWLFENSHPDIVPPKKYFKGFLGEGLSGSIYGKRARVKALVYGSHEIKNPTVSYPDSISIRHARRFRSRNGSMGANILKRFLVVFDYPNKKISLKKGAHFNKPFYYNVSGLELVHNGKILVKEKDNKSTSFNLSGNGQTSNNSVIIDYRYKYNFKPSYRVLKVLENSPADYAGVMVDDVLIKVNGKFVHEMKLTEIIEKFYYKKNRKVSLVVERNGQHYEFKFYLEDILQ